MLTSPDVTRRWAKQGYVAAGVDLLSREGGTASITDADGQISADDRVFDTVSDVLLLVLLLRASATRVQVGDVPVAVEI